MKTALIVVDVQRDFINGSLGGAGRDVVIKPLVEAAKKVDLVVASRDWHPPNHFSFSDDPQFVDGSWPPHCISGEPGAELHPEIAEIADIVVNKGMDREREAYSAFEGQDKYCRTLNAIISMHGVDTVWVGGLLIEFCVRGSVLDSVILGFKTFLFLPGSAGLSPETTEEAIREMQNAGAIVG